MSRADQSKFDWLQLFGSSGCGGVGGGWVIFKLCWDCIQSQLMLLRRSFPILSRLKHTMTSTSRQAEITDNLNAVREAIKQVNCPQEVNTHQLDYTHGGSQKPHDSHAWWCSTRSTLVIGTFGSCKQVQACTRPSLCI